MASTAVKISSELAELARREATAADRSLAGQIEHWAKLGRVVEAALSARTANALKVSAGAPNQPGETSNDGEAIHAALLELRDSLSADSRRFSEELRHGARESSVPLYEADPNRRGGIVRVNADGSKTPGSFVGREFVPAQELAAVDADSE